MRQLLLIIRSFGLFICAFVYFYIFLPIKACSHARSAAAFFVVSVPFLSIWRIPILGGLGEHAA